MNPAIRMYQAWKNLLQLRDEHLGPGTAQPLGKRERSVFVAAFDPMGEPILGFGHIGWYTIRRGDGSLSGDLALWADGSFEIRYWDNDLKHVCRETFLGWATVVGKRVLFFDHRRDMYESHLDSDDHAHPKAYFRWKTLPRQTRLMLVPDGSSWRIAVHPASRYYASACRTLDAEYDAAARRYLRAKRSDEIAQGMPRSTEEIVASNAERVSAISLMLDPYTPATRPKEKAHGNHLDTRTAHEATASVAAG